MLKRPDWISVKLWKRMCDTFPEVKPLPPMPSASVRREPRYYQGYSRLELAEEYFSVAAEESIGFVNLSWRTGTEKRGNDWQLQLTEEMLIGWVEVLRHAREKKEERAEWEERHYEDALLGWLKRHRPEAPRDLYDVRLTLDTLGTKLHDKAMVRLEPKPKRKKVSTKKKPAAKKKTPSGRRPA